MVYNFFNCFSNTDIFHETRIMLKLPKGLKKKKKGKKSKRKGEEELFTEEELEKYRREHQQQTETAEGSVKNEEWSKFKDLTTGVDSVLKKTQGDLDRIKSTSFFQRVPAGPKEVKPAPKEKLHRPVVEITEADFPQLVQAAAEADDGDKSDCGLTDDESEEDDQDDIFDTSYVDAVERGEVKLAYVPDSIEDFQDDDIFDTSHVDAIIKGQEARISKGKKCLDIGVAVEVLTGRIDNLTVTTKRSSKRAIPGDLLLEEAINTDSPLTLTALSEPEPFEKSILDFDSDIPITTPIDLSISLHTSLIQQSAKAHQEQKAAAQFSSEIFSDDEIDEFTKLATESLEVSAEATKLGQKEIKLEPVLQESWSAFEADKNESVFTECVIENQIDVIDPYIDGDDPFDTSFADAVVPSLQLKEVKKEAVILEDDDDFDPRAEEVQFRSNNRRKSSVRIHLTDPSGIRESITSDDIVDHRKDQEQTSLDLLGGSTTDLTQLGDSPLNPIDVNTDTDFDPFDTSIVDKVVAPGKVELKFLEQELIDATPVPVPVYRVPSDDDFDPRAEELKPVERRPSRPENLLVSKNVVFDVDNKSSETDPKNKNSKPLTPYYTREVSITEDLNEEVEGADTVAETLTRTHSDDDLAPKISYQKKRRHSEYPQTKQTKVKASDLLHSGQPEIQAKVLTPTGPQIPAKGPEIDPFDTSFASNIAPGRTELKLLAKEFSCEETAEPKGDPDFLEPSDDIFQVKALTPEPFQEEETILEEDFDPFDTSFASDLNPGRTELKLLESEFLGH